MWIADQANMVRGAEVLISLTYDVAPCNSVRLGQVGCVNVLLRCGKL